MNKNEMLRMNVGTELDEWCAMRVLDYDQSIFPHEAVDANGAIVETDWVNENGEPAVIPPFSTDLSAAFRIVDRLKKEGWQMNLHQSGDSYTCRFSRRLEFGTETFQVEPSFPKTFTAAEVITKCALLVALSQPREERMKVAI